MSSDQREPLWATSLAPDPDPRLEPDAAAEAEPVDAPEPVPAGRRDLVVAGVIAAATCLLAVLLAFALAVTDRTTVRIDTVPSAWLEVPMDCHTLRLERDAQAIELFSCRATGGGVLPAGAYRSPDSQWTSDLTRQDALTSDIVITPEGELTGVAAYVG